MVVSLLAEDVEAEVVEVTLAGGVLCELAVDGRADVGAVEGVDPENLAGGGAGGTGVTGRGGGLVCEDLDGEVLGEVVCSAGFTAGEVGDVVLPQIGLAVDGDQVVASEGGEVGFTGELAGLP